MASATGGQWTTPTTGPLESVQAVHFAATNVQAGDLISPLRQQASQPWLEKSLQRGAAAVMAAYPPQGSAVTSRVPWLRVAYPYEARLDMGRAARDRLSEQARVFGVTGSVGKTTTRHMIAAAMARYGKCSTNRGNYNCIEGTASTLASTPRDAIGVALEMAITFHFGDVGATSIYGRPHVAVVTMIDDAHLDFHGDKAGIALQKAGIFRGVLPGGAGVINADAPHAALLTRLAGEHGVERVITYGTSTASDVRIVSHRVGDDGRAQVEVDARGRRLAFSLAATSIHNALNAVGAATAVEAAGRSFEHALESLVEFQPPGRRMRLEYLTLAGGRRVSFLDDSFNASPVSMAACIEALGKLEPGPGGRRIFAMGEIARLAEHGQELHLALAEPLVAARVDVLYGVGPHVHTLGRALSGRVAFVPCPAAEDLAAALLADLREGDVVAMKGSLPSRLELAANALRSGAAPQPTAHSLPVEQRGAALNPRHAVAILDASAGTLLHAESPRRLQPHARLLPKIALVDVALRSLRARGLSLDAPVPLLPVKRGWRPCLGYPEGATLPFRELAKLVVIGSFTDTMYSLCHFIDPDPVKLLEMLRERARQVGTTDTKFVDAVGGVYAEQVTTSLDVARWFGRALLDDPDAEALLGAKTVSCFDRPLRSTAAYGWLFDDYVAGIAVLADPEVHAAVAVRREGRLLVAVEHWAPSPDAAAYATRHFLSVAAAKIAPGVGAAPEGAGR